MPRNDQALVLENLIVRHALHGSRNADYNSSFLFQFEPRSLQKRSLIHSPEVVIEIARDKLGTLPRAEGEGVRSTLPSPGWQNNWNMRCWKSAGIILVHLEQLQCIPSDVHLLLEAPGVDFEMSESFHFLARILGALLLAEERGCEALSSTGWAENRNKNGFLDFTRSLQMHQRSLWMIPSGP